MDSSKEYELKALVCELCRQFYQLGWVTGTGGSISIRHGDSIFMTPSGVQKERIKPEQVFMVDLQGKVIKQPDAGPSKLSDCAPLFLHAYNQRNAGAVLHSHGIHCNLVTLLFDGQSEFRITQQEMIKGIDGHGYYDELVIPIIENTAWEHELADSLGEAIARYPKSVAVLVRQHGMYVWGNTWEQAKRHGECLHYLFEAYVNAHKLGVLNLISSGTQRAPKFAHLLLDIEGTTTPISFVKDVLFPYSVQKVKQYLEDNWSQKATQEIVFELAANSSVEEDASAPKVNTKDIGSVVNYVHYLVAKDRKLGPLKNLQGLIWETGYAAGELKGVVFDDVPKKLTEAVQARGVKVSIYSSGSRQAQKLLFKYTNYGDLTKNLNAYFDTKVGPKTSATSYVEIALTLGAETDKILFVTDILAEAKAASEAGLSVLLSSRTGNASITEDHKFKVITSFEQIEL